MYITELLNIEKVQTMHVWYIVYMYGMYTLMSQLIAQTYLKLIDLACINFSVFYYLTK